MTHRFILGLLVLLGMASDGFSESLSGYQEEIQTVFISEAANASRFKNAVQTARLLGFLEFLPVQSFSDFHKCMSEEKTGWSFLSAKTRERLLNRCRVKGRSLSSLALSPVTAPSVRPATEEKQEQIFSQLRAEMNDLRSQVEKISRDMSQHQDRLLDALRAIENNLQTRSQTPPQNPETLQNY